MRRPGKGFLWVLTVGIVAVLVVIGLYLYRQDKAQQSQLLDEIAIAQQTIQQLRSTDTSALEAEIVDLQASDQSTKAKIAGLENVLREYTHSIEIEQTLFDAAQAANVTLIEIDARPSDSVEQNGITMEQMPMTVVAESSVPPELVNFSIKVTDALQSANVESVRLDVPEPASDDEESADQTSTIRIQLSIYFLE